MPTPLKVIGTLPDPRLERFFVQLPGKATLIFVAERIDATSDDIPAIPPSAQTGLLTDWVQIRQWATKRDGWYEIRWLYEAGLQEMPYAPNDTRSAADRNFQYSMEASLYQAPLTSHPNIKNFLCTYGGYMDQGQLVFPPWDPTGTSARAGFDQQGNYYGNINPFYGVDTFLSPQATLTRTYMTAGNELPTDQLYGLGYIDTPPDLPFVVTNPAASKTDNWLKSEAPAYQHGNDLEIDEGWESGGIGGWQRLIYALPVANS